MRKSEQHKKMKSSYSFIRTVTHNHIKRWNCFAINLWGRQTGKSTMRDAFFIAEQEKVNNIVRTVKKKFKHLHAN